jgi:hypothetical protein
MRVDDLIELPLDDYLQACAQRRAAIIQSSPVHRIIGDLGGYEGAQFASALWLRDWYEYRARSVPH